MFYRFMIRFIKLVSVLNCSIVYIDMVLKVKSSRHILYIQIDDFLNYLFELNNCWLDKVLYFWNHILKQTKTNKICMNITKYVTDICGNMGSFYWYKFLIRNIFYMGYKFMYWEIVYGKYLYLKRTLFFFNSNVGKLSNFFILPSLVNN